MAKGKGKGQSKGKAAPSKYVPPVDLSDDEAMKSDDDLSITRQHNDYDHVDEVVDYKALDSSSDDEESKDPSRWDRMQQKELDRIAKQSKSWGKNRETYYNADTMDYEIESDDEIARQEEKEAIRMQKEQAAEFNEQDFGLDDIITPFASTLSSTSSASLSSVISSAIKSGKGKDTGIASEEKIKHILSESPELLSLLDDFNAKVEVLQNEVRPLLKQAREEGNPGELDDGYSLLQTKEQLLLAFLTNIVFYLLLKAEGAPVQSHPVIKRILYIRSLLERMELLTDRMFDFVRQVVDPAGYEADRLAELEADKAEEGSDGDMDEDMEDDMDLNEDDEAAFGFDDEVEEKMAAPATKSKISVEEQERLALEEAHYAKMLNLSRKSGKSSKKSANPEMVLASRKRKISESLGNGVEAYDDYADLSGVKAVERAQKARMEDVRMAFEEARPSKSTKSNAFDGPNAKRLLHGYDDVEDDDFDLEVEKDDDTMDKNLAAYRKFASANKEKQKSRSASFKQAPIFVGENLDLMDSEDRRGATARIVKNRGLVRSRGKLDANPRAKHRAKHDKALIKRRSQVKEFTGSKGDNYSGEKGIKKNILRFRKIN